MVIDELRGRHTLKKEPAHFTPPRLNVGECAAPLLPLPECEAHKAEGEEGERPAFRDVCDRHRAGAYNVRNEIPVGARISVRWQKVLDTSPPRRTKSL